MMPDPDKTETYKVSSMTDAEGAQRLEEYVANIDVHNDVEEFASLICGQEIKFNVTFSRVMTAAEQAAGEATIKQLFEERDALPEGSPERHAVALKIFDFTFGGK